MHRFDEASGSVRAFAQDWYDRLLLGERPVPAGSRSARAACWRRPSSAAASGERPSGCGGGCASPVSRPTCTRPSSAACRGRTSLPSLDEPERWLDPGTRGPPRPPGARSGSPLPSGRTAALDYREDGSVVAAVKLQELFGLAETPRIGPRQVPVVFELLAPNGRPVQTTRDLRGFWERTYPEVRKELRGRYPRHPWPEDPWTAEPTHRTTKKRR